MSSHNATVGTAADLSRTLAMDKAQVSPHPRPIVWRD